MKHLAVNLGSVNPKNNFVKNVIFYNKKRWRKGIVLDCNWLHFDGICIVNVLCIIWNQPKLCLDHKWVTAKQFMQYKKFEELMDGKFNNKYTKIGVFWHAYELWMHKFCKQFSFLYFLRDLRNKLTSLYIYIIDITDRVNIMNPKYFIGLK